MVLVDTDVLVDVLQNDPQWAEWSIAQLRAQAKLHALAINPIIHAEISLSFSTLEALDDVVLTMALGLREIRGQPFSWPRRRLPNTDGAAAARRRCCPTSSSARTLPSRAGPC